WTERARRLARVRRHGHRQSGVARNARGDLSRVPAGRRWELSLSRRARAPAVAGSPAEGLPGDRARESLPGARDVGAAGAEPRPAVCHAERTGRADAHQAAAALLRPAGLVFRLLDPRSL